MRFLRPVAAAFAAVCFFVVFFVLPASAAIVIEIDKSAQRMTVSQDGAQLYAWPVSTGLRGHDTPSGEFKPFRMEKVHFSREWDDAPMPHSIFFTRQGHSIHGSDHPGLGTPVSHGCVRLSLTNATTLYDLVTAEGMGKTSVIVRGDDPPGYYTPSQPPQQKRPFAPFGGLFRF